jgi:hypothetical protein
MMLAPLFMMLLKVGRIISVTLTQRYNKSVWFEGSVRQVELASHFVPALLSLASVLE